MSGSVARVVQKGTNKAHARVLGKMKLSRMFVINLLHLFTCFQDLLMFRIYITLTQVRYIREYIQYISQALPRDVLTTI
jgi:hypothetical protein